MIIAISSEGNKIESLLDMRFGRSSYFFLFNTENDTYEIIENTARNVAGGAGNATVQILNKYNVEAVISGNYGPHALAALQVCGINAYTAKAEVISLVYEKFKKNLLTQIPTSTL